MKHRSSASDQPTNAPTHTGSDLDFACFWADIVSAICTAASSGHSEAPDAFHAWLTPFQAQDTSVAYEGQATAVGEDTYASAKMTMNLTDFGFLSFTTGTSELQAIARSDPGETAYTDTSGVFIPDGADIIVQTTTIVQGSWSDETGEWSASTSTTSFFAIDFTWFDLPKAWTFQMLDTQTAARPQLAAGNIATAAADVSANGDNTLTDFSADVLTVEDTISSATLVGLASAFG